VGSIFLVKESGGDPGFPPLPSQGLIQLTTLTFAFVNRTLRVVREHCP
jgi:hypothetical protein